MKEHIMNDDQILGLKLIEEGYERLFKGKKYLFDSDKEELSRNLKDSSKLKG